MGALALSILAESNLGGEIVTIRYWLVFARHLWRQRDGASPPLEKT